VHVLASGARQIAAQFDLESRGTANLATGCVYDHCGGHVRSHLIG